MQLGNTVSRIIGDLRTSSPVTECLPRRNLKNYSGPLEMLTVVVRELKCRQLYGADMFPAGTECHAISGVCILDAVIYLVID